MLLRGGKKYHAKSLDELKTHIKTLMYDFNHHGNLIIKPIDFFLRNLDIYRGKKIMTHNTKNEIIWECYKNLLTTQIINQYDLDRIYYTHLEKHNYPDCTDLIVIGYKSRGYVFGGTDNFNSHTIANELSSLGLLRNQDYFIDDLESKSFVCCVILVKKTQNLNAFLIRLKYSDKVVFDIDVDKVYTHLEKYRYKFEYQDIQDIIRTKHYLTKCDCLTKDLLI